MRLLRLQNNGGFSLVEYVGKAIPPYAILSHTWGADDEEVTLKDLMEGTGNAKAGYKKLTFCGKQATNDRLQFFWVDTCCIDKSSSAELTEAINSMFEWYHKAAKCYVYLSDVPINGFKQSFQKSRWFSRGWTLQELVAPKSVEFFSLEGERIGDKSLMVQEISDITRIPIKALQGTPLSHFSIDERMSWAKRRETKREEDAAYSLLGIFDIYMSLLYGEGKKNAFLRLRKEIKESPNHVDRATLKAERFCITAISRKAEHLDLFLCGPDGKVHTLWWIDGKGWSRNSTNVEGDFPPGAKVTVVSMDAEKLDLFACDINGRIFTNRWHVPEKLLRILRWTFWSCWYMVGEQFPGGTEVAAISRKGKLLDLFARAEDEQIHTLQWTKEEGWPKNFQGQPLPRNSQGFSNGAHITITARNDEHMNLFVCDSDGNIQVVGWSSDAGWTAWKSIGQGFSTQTEITAIVRNEDALEIFACRPNGQICTTNWKAHSGWKHTWKTISFGEKFKAQSKVAAAKLSETTELFVHGSDDFIHTCWCSALQPEWSAWELIGRQQFRGSVDVVAVVRVGSRSVDLLVSNSDGQGLTVWWTRGSKLSWEHWRQLQLPDIFKSHK